MRRRRRSSDCPSGPSEARTGKFPWPDPSTADGDGEQYWAPAVDLAGLVDTAVGRDVVVREGITFSICVRGVGDTAVVIRHVVLVERYRIGRDAACV